MTYDELLETVAAGLAAMNNGGDWAVHYHEAQRVVWRERAASVIALVRQNPDARPNTADHL